MRMINELKNENIVVPLLGTWIEIPETVAFEELTVVVPLLGTWIEISADHAGSQECLSRSLIGNVD